MVKHFDNLIFSKIIKDNDYSFSNPKFGRSNTDQSFYEPMASMVQNAQKSGSVSSSLHNDAEKSIKEIRNSSDFLPNYMTQEEIQAMIVNQQESVDKSIESVKLQVETIKEQIKNSEEIVQKSTVTD